MFSEFDSESQIQEKLNEEQELIEQITPLDDYVFTTHVPRSNRLGLLYVPDDKREDIQQGKVLRVGRGLRTPFGRLKLTVQIGDTVLWAKHWEKPIDLGRYLHCAAVREKDIIGIVKDDTLIPIYNSVVIEPDPLPEREGLLYLPKQYIKPLMPALHGTVVSCGPGHLQENGNIIPLTVKVGDKVCYEPFGGENHTFGNKELRLIPEEHILAIID